MAENNWVISGYRFATEADYEKAKREGESILYIKAHTDMTNFQQVLKVYNKAVDTNMFQTVLGYEFLHHLYAIIVKNQVVEPEYLKPIPIRKQIEEKEVPKDIEEANQLAEQYRRLYEDAAEKKKRTGIVSGFLVLLIVIMVTMVYVHYNSNSEEAILDKYAAWEAELEEREDAVKEKEEQLQKKVNDENNKEEK